MAKIEYVNGNIIVDGTYQLTPDDITIADKLISRNIYYKEDLANYLLDYKYAIDDNYSIFDILDNYATLREESDGGDPDYTRSWIECMYEATYGKVHVTTNRDIINKQIDLLFHER